MSVTTKLTENQEQEICRLYAEDNISHKILIKQFHISKPRLYGLLQNNNIQIRQQLRLIIDPIIEKEILRLYIDEKFPRTRIMKRLNIGEHYVLTVLENNKIKIRRGIFSKNLDKQRIKRLYKKGYSSIDIAKKLGVTPGTIICILKKMNIKRRINSCGARKYTVNESYFDVIDSHEKAYILGWLFADGNNMTDMRGFRIKLQNCDQEIIYQFKKFLNAKHPITFNKDNKQACLVIHSTKMSDDLNKLNCTPQKSFTLDWPANLSNEYIPIFIRGYFEGDGCISNYQHKTCKTLGYNISIISSQIFSEKLREIIKKEIGVEFRLRWHRNKRNLMVCSACYFNIVKFLTWIYKDYPELRLSRKYKRVKQMLKSKDILFKKYTEIQKDYLPITN